MNFRLAQTLNPKIVSSDKVPTLVTAHSFLNNTHDKGPHCLNRGGTLAQCGLLLNERTGDVPVKRNYDSPRSHDGKFMPTNIQGVYREGSTIEVEFMITTHHKGHIEMSACPIIAKRSSAEGSRAASGMGMPVPTAECFQRFKLKFIKDEVYGAPQDPAYPERGYITPASKAKYVQPIPGEIPVLGAYYKMYFELPAGLSGDVVLLQWCEFVWGGSFVEFQVSLFVRNPYLLDYLTANR